MKNKAERKPNIQECSCPSGCDSGIERRDFLKLVALGTAAGLAPQRTVMAGPFQASDFEKMIPADKKLDAAWVKSLFAQGTPTVYRGPELEKIGMPIGGICAGQLYLGGDGKLWRWDIFNQRLETADRNYANPPKPASPLDQGFGLRVSAGGKTEYRALDRSGFSDISFRGEYPIGLVEYADSKIPVQVSLEAFSPFIPLDAKESALPATILRYTVKNTSQENVGVEVIGWLQNAVRLFTGKAGEGHRENRVIRQADILLLDCSVKAPNAAAAANFGKQHDFGTMSLGLLAPEATDIGAASLPAGTLAEAKLADMPSASVPIEKKLVGALARKLSLQSGQSATVTFVITWNFPNLRLKDNGRFYATLYSTASAVAEHVAKNFDALYRQTRLWHDTWYDSTLPYWFLDRTFANTSILASSTCHWLKNGRFYGWEGVCCCAGTCTHVWHYAHAVGRLFPELERDLRQRTDFGTAMDIKTGVINHRGEEAGLAVDGQAGCILRAYREHQMSKDAAFLQKLWPKVKLAMQCLVRMDNHEGILEGAQHNTLDQAWFGKVAWLSSLYLAAARACEAMANEVGDDAYAKQMHEIVELGRKSLDRDLFNGEYYVQSPDKNHVKTVGSYNGCEVDQIFGQSWAYQVGLGRILDEKNVKKALASLWSYNFTPDVGPFRAKNKPGRWYAMAGEAGLIMCTWPKGDEARVRTGFDFYFNECMNGFEYQVAGHMIWEGMVQEGLAITRAVHDRYHALRRNPWNEVECGDHYARSMASYGVFLAACGYEYHGPKGHLAFTPRLTPENFRAAFTTAEGWGTFSQQRDDARQGDTIELKSGKLRLRTLTFALADKANPKGVRVTVNGTEAACQHRVENAKIVIELAAETVLQAGQKIEVAIA